MAYALVGSVGAVAAGTTTVTPAFGQSPTAGHLLIACVSTINAVGTSDAGPNAVTGWTEHTTNAGTSSISESVSIFEKIAVGGDAAPTFVDSSATTIEAVLAEFSGNNAVPFDRTGFATAVSSPTTPIAAGNDAAAGDLMISVYSESDSKAITATTSSTFTDGGGATPASHDLGNNDATSTAFHFRFSYAIGTSGSITQADQVALATSSKSINRILGIIATYAPAAAATGVPYRSIYRQMLAQFRRLEDGLYAPRRGLWLPRREIVLANDLLLAR